MATKKTHQKTTKPPAKSTAVKTVAPKKNGGARENAGRLSDEYKPEYCQQLMEFFSPNKNAYEIVTNDKGEQMQVARPPIFARFAVTIGVTKRTLYNWAHNVDKDGNLVHPEFAQAYEMAKDMAESIKVEGATMKLYDPKMVTMDLMVNHGWKPEQHTTVTVKTDFDELDNTYKEISKQRIEKERAIQAEKLAILEADKVDDAV